MSGSSPLATPAPQPRRRLRLVLMLMGPLLVLCVIGVLALTLYQEAIRPFRYQARADVLILGGSSLSVDQKPVDENVLSTHMLLIKSPYVLKRAAHSLRAMKTFEGDNDVVARLIDGLEVKRAAPGADILSLTFRGPVEEDCPWILFEVIEAYSQFVNDSHKDNSREALELTSRAELLLRYQLQALRQQGPDPSSGQEKTENQLAQLSSRRFTLRIRAFELRKQIESLERAAKEQPHPLGVTLEASRWAMQSGYDKLPAEVKKDADPLQAYILALKQELEENQLSDAALGSLLAEEQKQAVERSRHEWQETDLRRKIETTQQLYDSIFKRVQGLELMQSQGLKVVVINPPQMVSR